jgi:hypothetical protein
LTRCLQLASTEVYALLADFIRVEIIRMEHHPASRPNVVSLFFGVAMAAVLLAVLVATLFFNKLPQPQPTDPALMTQSQQPGYSFTEAAANETVNNKALSILLAVGSMAVGGLALIVTVGTLANRRVSREIADFDHYAGSAATKVVLQYQHASLPNKAQVIRVNRVSRR